MTMACNGWYKYVIPDAHGEQVRMAFTDGKTWDNNGGQGIDYRVNGDSIAISNRQFISDVIPNCAINNNI